LQDLQTKGQSPTQYIFAPDPLNKKIVVFQRDSSKMIPAASVKKTADALDLELPDADLPTTAFDTIISHALSKESAKIRAGAQVQASQIRAGATVKSAQIRSGAGAGGNRIDPNLLFQGGPANPKDRNFYVRTNQKNLDTA